MKYVTQAAKTAKAIRQELKSLFPSIKFQIRSETYSGGNSVNIGYTDGVCQKTIESVVNKYQQGKFNSMEDIYEITNRDESIPQVKYIFVDRKMSNEVLEQLLVEIGLTMDQYQDGWCEHFRTHYSTVVYKKFQTMSFGEFADNNIVEDEADEDVLVFNSESEEAAYVLSIFDEPKQSCSNANEISLDEVAIEDTPDAVVYINKKPIKIDGWQCKPVYPNTTNFDELKEKNDLQSVLRINKVYAKDDPFKQWFYFEDLFSESDCEKYNLKEMVQRCYDMHQAIAFEFLCFDNRRNPVFIRCSVIEVLQINHN